MAVAVALAGVAGAAAAQERLTQSALAGVTLPEASRAWSEDPEGSKAATLDLASSLTSRTCGPTESHLWRAVSETPDQIRDKTDAAFTAAGWSLETISRGAEGERTHLARRGTDEMIMSWMPTEGGIGLLLCKVAGRKVVESDFLPDLSNMRGGADAVAPDAAPPANQAALPPDAAAPPVGEPAPDMAVPRQRPRPEGEPPPEAVAPPDAPAEVTPDVAEQPEQPAPDVAAVEPPPPEALPAAPVTPPAAAPISPPAAAVPSAEAAPSSEAKDTDRVPQPEGPSAPQVPAPVAQAEPPPSRQAAPPAAQPEPVVPAEAAPAPSAPVQVPEAATAADNGYTGWIVRLVTLLLGMGAFGGAAFLLLRQGLASRGQVAVTAGWPKALAVVLSSRVDVVQHTDAGGREVIRFRPNVDYEFEVGGKIYRSDCYHLGSPGEVDRAVAERQVQGLPRGSAIEISFDPLNPANATIATNARRPNLQLLLGGGAALAALACLGAAVVVSV